MLFTDRFVYDYAVTRDASPDLHELRFVRTDQLNRGLYDFFVREGYDAGDVSFVLGEGKVLPRGRGAAQEWQHYYTPELKAWVRGREDFPFRLFPEFDV